MAKEQNKKSKSQNEKSYQQPIPKKGRKATVIITPDDESKVDIQTGNVSDLEMYMYLRDMTKHFATVVCKDATEVVGENTEDQIKYLNWRIEQSGLNQ